ncbi:hypothetical protein IWQ60_002433 [Tieghemiomyces parasiticus]|uniref:WD40 repeat-like protein n=1 Tax=Tieghemiomyces parasiticus TaxID=78921 RepID=A0A9W8AC64_9FUNG|nr:hypothetical protein IWQ60_002433 [Tieghemiomyces parasiticus]
MLSRPDPRARGDGQDPFLSAEEEIDIDNDDEDYDAPKKRGGRKTTTKKGSSRTARKAETSDLADANSKSKTSGKAKPTSKADTSAKAKPRKKSTAKGKKPAEVARPPRKYDPDLIDQLAAENPDTYWDDIHAPDSQRITHIDAEHPLGLVSVDIRDHAAITGMILSPDGTLLVTCCNTGSVKLWDLGSFALVQNLRDASEKQIDEFFVARFTPDQSHLIVGGKLKDRQRWSEVDDDNHILPCPLKVFNVLSGEVVARHEGHMEEILCIKLAKYRGQNYALTTSQDGYILKWHLTDDWINLVEHIRVEDGITCMAFTVSFVPRTGNRYFMGACDEHVKLYDFEHARLLRTFENLYSSYCDCGKFIECLEIPYRPGEEPAAVELETVTATATSSSKRTSARVAASTAAGMTESAAVDTDASATDVVIDEVDPDSAYDDTRPPGLPQRPFAHFITRGVELLDAENNTIASRPNTCTLHQLLYPDEDHDDFELEEIRRFHHDEYLSNSWLIKITANGRYLLAPTLNGQVYVFHLATGAVTGVIKGHEEIEVRDVLFHPQRDLLFTSGDDGRVVVYSRNPENIMAERQQYLDSTAGEGMDGASGAVTITAADATQPKSEDETDIDIDG